jgi:hypothetical protein
MGIIASSLSRRDAAVKPIPRRDRGTTEEYEVMFFEEERLGPAALEAPAPARVEPGHLTAFRGGGYLLRPR